MRAAKIKCFLFPLFTHNSLLHKLAAVGSGTEVNSKSLWALFDLAASVRQRHNCIITSFPQHSIVWKLPKTITPPTAFLAQWVLVAQKIGSLLC